MILNQVLNMLLLLLNDILKCIMIKLCVSDVIRILSTSKRMRKKLMFYQCDDCVCFANLNHAILPYFSNILLTRKNRCAKFKATYQNEHLNACVRHFTIDRSMIFELPIFVNLHTLCIKHIDTYDTDIQKWWLRLLQYEYTYLHTIIIELDRKHVSISHVSSSVRKLKLYACVIEKLPPLLSHLTCDYESFKNMRVIVESLIYLKLTHIHSHESFDFSRFNGLQYLILIYGYCKTNIIKALPLSLIKLKTNVVCEDYILPNTLKSLNIRKNKIGINTHSALEYWNIPSDYKFPSSLRKLKVDKLLFIPSQVTHVSFYDFVKNCDFSHVTHIHYQGMTCRQLDLFKAPKLQRLKIKDTQNVLNLHQCTCHTLMIHKYDQCTILPLHVQYIHIQKWCNDAILLPHENVQLYVDKYEKDITNNIYYAKSLAPFHQKDCK